MSRGVGSFEPSFWGPRVVRIRSEPLSVTFSEEKPGLIPSSQEPKSWLEAQAAAKDQPSSSADELWMEEALRCAQRALEMGEVPVGAVIVSEGKIVGRGWNRNIIDRDPSAHAEVIALREAGAHIDNHRLERCELFVTIEPCAMCAGAMVHARIQRLVYGSDDPKAGAVHSVMQVLNHPHLNHRIEIRGGVLAGRSAEILQTFFKNRR